VGSFTDLSAFAAKISQRNDAVSQFLITQFSDETRRELQTQEATKPIPKALQTLIVKDLNTIISNGKIHDHNLFHGIALRKKHGDS
jgi:flagellar basal body-associated protein FliL